MANRNPKKMELMPAWKPGQSVNPSGRPRTKPISDRYAYIAERELPGEGREITRRWSFGREKLSGRRAAVLISQTMRQRGPKCVATPLADVRLPTSSVSP